ncbi:MAG: hypothetical protein M9949_14405 [Candidatus Kapabacteria bacterium]|nr:hypothetical protein [Candidatus Kapabacteria bacterium]
MSNQPVQIEKDKQLTVYVKRDLQERIQKVKAFFLLPRDTNAASHCIKAGLEVFKDDPERFKRLVAR